MQAQKQKKPKTNECCPVSKKSKHPDHTDCLPRLRRVQGQIRGIEQMIEEGRYCVDILVQFRAAMAALRSLEVKVFQKHLAHCVENAFQSNDVEEMRKKVDELSDLLLRRTVI